MKLIETTLLLIAMAFFLAAHAPTLLMADDGGEGESRYCDKTGNKCHHVNGAGCGQGGSGLASTCSLVRDEQACFKCEEREGLLCGDQDATCGDLKNAKCNGGAAPAWGAVNGQGHSVWFNVVDQAGNYIQCNELKECTDGSASKRQCG